MIDICTGVVVSEHELKFSFDRCSGPGGQNVNKVNTRVTLHFSVTNSTSLSRAQKSMICEKTIRPWFICGSFKNLRARITHD